MKLLVGLVVLILLFSVFITEGSASGKAKKIKSAAILVESDSSTSSSESYEAEDEEVEVEEEKEMDFFFSLDKYDMKKAWNSATTLTDRNPSIWRVDNNNNIILFNGYTKSSPLAFRALLIESPTGIRSLEAVQKDHLDIVKGGLRYIPKNQEQDDLLSLIEIALIGGVSDDRGEPYCWCPSSIHQDLFRKDANARRWHMDLYNNDLKYGMAGHNIAFQHLRIALKDINNIPLDILNAKDQMHTTMYIHNFQPQCSDVVGSINFRLNQAQWESDLKSNWGLPVVSEFVVRSTSSYTMTPGFKPSTSHLNKLISSSSSSIKKKSITKKASAQSSSESLSFSENEWPSLSAPVSQSSSVSKIKKPNSKSTIQFTEV